MVRSLSEYSDDELNSALARSLEHVDYRPVDYQREIERRGANRQTSWSFRLAVLVGIATIVNVAVAVWNATSK